MFFYFFHENYFELTNLLRMSAVARKGTSDTRNFLHSGLFFQSAEEKYAKYKGLTNIIVKKVKKNNKYIYCLTVTTSSLGLLRRQRFFVMMERLKS